MYLLPIMDCYKLSLKKDKPIVRQYISMLTCFFVFWVDAMEKAFVDDNFVLDVWWYQDTLFHL